MRSLLARLLRRFARSLGISELQEHADRLVADIDRLHRRLEVIEHHRLQDLEIHSRGVEQISRDAFTVAQFSEKRASDYTDVQISSLEKNLHSQIVSALEGINFHTDQRKIQIDQDLEEIRHIISSSITDTDERLSAIRRRIDVLGRAAESTPRVANEGLLPANDGARNDSPHLLSDDLYVALEDRFRGNPDDVAVRQEIYLSIVTDVIDTEHPLLDVGCGRGEWLKLLRRTNLPARGLDSNRSCIAECRESGLDVTAGDVMTHLSSLSDSSLGAITLFQVMEHLPFPVVLNVLRESRRTLVPGGVLIAEIPNVKNVRVGAGTFWIDPTHQHPLFPDVLMFLAEESGFCSIEGRYLNPLMPAPDVSGLPHEIRARLQALFEALDGPADFALIARA